MKTHINILLAAALAIVSAPCFAAGPDKANIGISTSKNYIRTRIYTSPQKGSAIDDVA